MTDQATNATAGGSPLDGGVRPSPSEWKCSHCGFPLTRHGGALRHYGTHTAHQENECLRLLRAEIERLRAELRTRHERQHEAEGLAGHYLVQRDDAREALAAEREQRQQAREELVQAWNNLPDALRCHPGLTRLYAAAQRA